MVWMGVGAVRARRQLGYRVLAGLVLLSLLLQSAPLSPTRS